MKLYVGSINRVKVSAVVEALDDFDLNIIPFEANSEVGAQPIGDEQTLQGAINRANSLPTNGLRIGLEAGVTLLNEQLYLVNFGALIDEDNELYVAGGTRLPLPNEIKDLIFNKGLELADAMKEYFNVEGIKHQNGAVGYFTNDLVKRKEILIHITKLLYGQYLYKQKNK